ncbi:conserved hypothetical protein [Burkholderia vietnamiensis]|nr:conserved hypothetical protein [Burkholderia vietnamiensis]
MRVLRRARNARDYIAGCARRVSVTNEARGSTQRCARRRHAHAYRVETRARMDTGDPVHDIALAGYAPDR